MAPVTFLTEELVVLFASVELVLGSWRREEGIPMTTIRWLLDLPFPLLEEDLELEEDSEFALDDDSESSLSSPAGMIE